MTHTFQASRIPMQICVLYWCFSTPVSYWRHQCNFANYCRGRVYSNLPVNWIVRQCRGIMERKCWVTLQTLTPSDKLSWKVCGQWWFKNRHCKLPVCDTHIADQTSDQCICRFVLAVNNSETHSRQPGCSLQCKLCSMTVRATLSRFWKRKMPLHLRGVDHN